MTDPMKMLVVMALFSSLTCHAQDVDPWPADIDLPDGFAIEVFAAEVPDAQSMELGDRILFIAEHGSWNRSEPIGYRVTPVRINDCVAKAYETFAEGWLQNGEAWGSPVDILLLPDGSMLVSGDKAGQIFRIHYAGKAIRN